MILLYRLFITLYQLGIRLAAAWNPKAKQWLSGRKNLFAELSQTFPLAQPVIWVHSSSAGEFEQAKPVIDALKKEHPDHQIVVTFFSPSGYAVGKKSAVADQVFYLPVDTKKNADRFLSLVQPRLVIFVKYDYWYYHLKAVRERNIPLLLVSAIYRNNQAFFRWYGGFYRNMLHFFTQLFVQDETSYGLLKKFGINHCTISGDTRFDRVATIAGNFTQVPFIKEFVGNHPALVAGSTWPEDEKALAAAYGNLKNLKLVIAPHEINEDHIRSIENLFPKAIRYSAVKAALGAGPSQDSVLWENEKDPQIQAVKNQLAEAPVLIIDNIGMLSRLYHYATVTYVGGGFNKSGIHNTLEAAVYGKPVIWGPNYQKFREAKELIAAGGGISYTSAAECQQILHTLLNDKAAYTKASMAALQYVQQNKGATEKIMNYIQENRLLTK